MFCSRIHPLKPTLLDPFTAATTAWFREVLGQRHDPGCLNVSEWITLIGLIVWYLIPVFLFNSFLLGSVGYFLSPMNLMCSILIRFRYMYYTLVVSVFFCVSIPFNHFVRFRLIVSNLSTESCDWIESYMFNVEFEILARCWSQIFFILISTWGNDPIWRIFFTCN